MAPKRWAQKLLRILSNSLSKVCMRCSRKAFHFLAGTPRAFIAAFHATSFTDVDPALICTGMTVQSSPSLLVASLLSSLSFPAFAQLRNKPISLSLSQSWPPLPRNKRLSPFPLSNYTKSKYQLQDIYSPEENVAKSQQSLHVLSLGFIDESGLPKCALRLCRHIF